MNLIEYAKRLGVETPTAKAVDIAAGKAGYEKYLADTANGKIYLPGAFSSLEDYAQQIDEWKDKSFGEKLKSRWQNLKQRVGVGDTDDYVIGGRTPTQPLARFLKGEITWKELQAINKGIADQDYARPEDDWTDDEKWAFGELYAKDRASAFNLAEKINNQHAEEKKQKQAERIANWTDRNVANKVLGSVGSLAINAAAGGAAYTEALGQKAVFGRTYNKDYLMPHEIANTMQGAVAENLSEKSKALGYIYNIGMSVGQSTLAGVTGGSAGALVQFFGMSASNGFTDAKSRGADDDQALTFATFSGLAEAIPEMISVDKFLGLASAAQVDNVFKSILKQAGAEALEEATTSVLTEVADRWVMQGKSNYALTVQELIESGMTEDEAKKKAFTQTLLGIAGDAVTGALSGAASGGIAVGFNKLNNKYLRRKTNAEAKETLTPEASNLIEEGKKHESSTKQAQRLEKKLAEGKELSGYELRMLAYNVSEATNNANVDTVRQAIIEKMKAEGVSEKDAKRLGEIALNKALGNDVSKIQDVMLRRNEAANKVYNQIDESHMESGIADSDWIESTSLRQLRAEKKAEKEATASNTQAAATGVERLKQDLMAKKIAKNYKINDASLEGKFAVSEDDKIKFKKSSENSKIHTEEITTSLTKEDIAELTAIEKIANELGVDIYVYESKRNKDGSRTFKKSNGEATSDSGWYDPNDKSIHIDLRAGNNGEGTMLYTASHELVHFMKDNAPEHYDALEKLVLDALEKSGVSIEKELERQRKSLIANGKKSTDADFEEVAREEMIADACMKFLASKNAVAEIKALKTKNRGLWNALKKFFTSLFTKINKVYKTVEPDSATAKYLSEMRNAIKPIRDAFMEGITAAGEKYTAERKALGEGANVKVDSNGEFVQGATKDKKTILSNARTWEKGGRATLKATLESEGFSADDVKAALTIMDEHMRLVTEFGKKYTAQDIANNAVLTTDVKTGESVLSAIISNVDYPVNIDLLTICKKREAYQQVINRLCESGMINKATIDSLAIAEINKILGKYGFETACLGCYVESRRIRIQEWADTIVKEWNGIVDKLEGKGKGKYLNAASDAFVSDLSNEEISKLSTELDEAYVRDGLKYGRQTVVKKMEQLQREVPSLRRYLSISDLITPEGRANLKSWSQEVNSLINCRYGTNTPKIIQKFNPYNSELAQYGIVPKAYKSLRDYLYAIGGARMQSFSDFIVENWFDYAQIVADLSARKLPMHTYTKELALVKLFGMTGIKINMSLIPDVDSSLGKEYAGLTKNSKGEYELIFADKDRYKATGGKSYMQSINFADAIALQNDPNYSANIGTIAIGVSDKQIEMMLDDSRIRMVIPYHSSGMNPIFAHLVGIKNYNDYTNEQNTGVKRLVDANGKEKSVKLKKERIASLTKGFQYNEALQRLGDARAAANEYKEWCRDTSKHTIEIDGKTYYAELTPKFEKFSAHENYYKLLTDYNAYDCITEESKPQQDVTQTYPENFATMLEDELKARDIYAKKQDAKWDDAMAEINAYLETHTRADTVKYADEHGIKISAKDRKLAKQESAKKEIRSKVRNIVGASGKNYGKGVYLDSTLLTNLSETERVQMVKEYVKELGGSVFTAYDNSNNPVNVHIAAASRKFKNKSGKKVPVNKDMTSYLNNVVKQESIALVDELILTSKLTAKEPALHSHDWLDNYGANDWEYWTTFVQDKENTIWEATLNIATSENGEKILYDIVPIKMVEQSVTSDTSTTDNRIPQSTEKVNPSDENSPKEIRSKARAVDVNGNELSEAQQEYFKDSTVRDSKGNLMVLYHGTTANFNEFKKGDVGFHFGTKGAARGRVGYGKNVTLKEVYLNIKNPIVFDDDLGSWDADYRLTRELYDRGILTQSEAETVLLTDSKLYKRTTEAANKKLAEVLLTKGYDGIQYTNTHESKKDSTSYIIFDSNQAKLITNANPTTSKDIRHKTRSAPSTAIPYTSPTANAIVTNIDSGYEYTKRDKIKTSYIAAQIAMTNAQAGIEARAKQYGVKNIESLVQAARVATNQAQEMIGGNQYRIGSDTKDYLGEGLQKIYKPIQEKGEEYERTFFDYLFHQHNADRMSLERRSIEWNEQKKEEMKNLAQRAKEIRNEEMKLTGEKTKWAYKRSEEARSERNRIDLKLKELSRELVSIGKARRKLQKEIDSFEALKNKPVIGLNHDEVEAKKAEISARITELVAEKRKLGTKKANEEKVKEINSEIEALKQERFGLTAEVTEEKSREIIAEYEKNYPEFIETAQKIWKYSENLNLFRVDAGLIDQEQFDYLKKLYPHYVPSYRADTKTGIAAIKGKNNVAVSQSIRTATGSTKDLLNPIVIMARQTMETIRAGRINMIAKALYDGAAANNDTTYIKEISKKAVDKSKLVDLDPTELRPKSNQVTFFKDGQRITLQVSSDIFAGFDAFTPQVDATNPILQITHKANDIFKKLVTAWNPLFIIRNSIRDIQDAGINTKYGKTFVQNYIRAGNEIRTGGNLWELYKAMGGTNVNLFDFDKGFKGEQSKMGFEAGLMKKIANANAFVECLPRFAEFISSIEAGNTAEQAMLDAADVTTNFARTGTITKKLNSTIIPFLNPAIQGASKAIRNITSIRSFREALILITKAALVGVLPFVLNNLLLDDDEDYKVLKETDKENNYLIKVGDVFLKLPRGRMASVLAGATNRTIDSINGEEKAWKGYLKNASTQMNPIENMARTIFSPFMDVKNNVTWYGSAIEGREFENKSPSQRYDESTSSIAIALGKFLNYSPKKIHYILDQYSGVVGDFVLPATTKKAEKGFISGNFVIDPVTSNKLSEQFYDMYYDAQYAKSDNPDDKTAEYQVKHLNRVKDAIGKLYDKKSEIQNSNMSNSEKLAETRAIQILINEMYKTALNDYELVTKAIEATSSVDDKYRYTEVQRLVYCAETALKTWDDTVYEKSTLLKRSGISYDNFYQYYFGIKDIESDKDKNGNTISGSKKKKVVEKINSLKISEANKLLLIAYSGYSIDSANDREKLLKYINGLKLSTSEKKKLADILNFEYKNGKIVENKK